MHRHNDVSIVQVGCMVVRSRRIERVCLAGGFLVCLLKEGEGEGSGLYNICIGWAQLVSGLVGCFNGRIIDDRYV